MGHVYIVGAGPGDPGLITVAGVEALGRADVVLYDALATPQLLRHARPTAELVYVGKRANQHALTQDEINAAIVAHSSQGRTVVRLKGGDPFVFGRGSEEALACREAGAPFTVVPGITSAIAAAAYAGIPVTHRGLASSFMVATGSGAEQEDAAIDWSAAARVDTLVILMGAGTLDRIADRLVAAGRPPATPAACVRWGTRADQAVVRGTLETIAARAREAGLGSPMVTIVGDVVGLSEQLAWFTPGPLAGRRVVVTRSRAQSSELAARLTALGALVVEAPVIATRWLTPNPKLREALLSKPAWLCVASQNGVAAVAAELDAAGLDARALAGVRVAAIGEATGAELRAHGIRADFVPDRATTAALADELPLASGERVVLATSTLADDGLEVALTARGAVVERVDAYETVFEALDAERLREVVEADAVTFTSASTAHNLAQALAGNALPAGARLISIGPQTSSAVEVEFGRMDAEARVASIDALVEAVVDALQ
ncbi:MAG: uroporphyrinogen-III C-methyltransferase [Chloroflexi bacterium]|nr:uroporphyrinogen-III C-methyltransferase [Chloroflexota bacterium]